MFFVSSEGLKGGELLVGAEVALQNGLKSRSQVENFGMRQLEGRGNGEKGYNEAIVHVIYRYVVCRHILTVLVLAKTKNKKNDTVKRLFQEE